MSLDEFKVIFFLLGFSWEASYGDHSSRFIRKRAKGEDWIVVHNNAGTDCTYFPALGTNNRMFDASLTEILEEINNVYNP